MFPVRFRLWSSDIHFEVRFYRIFYSQFQPGRRINKLWNKHKYFCVVYIPRETGKGRFSCFDVMRDVQLKHHQNSSDEEIKERFCLPFCEDRSTYRCWPSFKTIGKATRMSSNTVRPIQEAEEQFYQQQLKNISLDVQREKASGTKAKQERPA